MVIMALTQKQSITNAAHFSQNKTKSRRGGGEGREGGESFKYYFNFICYSLFTKLNHTGMEGEIKKQNPNIGRKPLKKDKMDSPDSSSQEQKSNFNNHSQSQAQEQSDSSSGWSNEVIEPAIKSMTFRNRRGTRMKDLIKGKHRKDQFWQKYQDYFGGDLDKPEDSQDQEDYEASSSGRDQFDSDFDLTDSYVGKRGRKKGTKIRKRRRAQPKKEEEREEGPPAPKGRRGRKKKVAVDSQPQQNSKILLKAENGVMQQKELYMPQCRSDDVFLIIKKPKKNTRQPRSKKIQQPPSNQKQPLQANNGQIKHEVKPTTSLDAPPKEDICAQLMISEQWEPK